MPMPNGPVRGLGDGRASSLRDSGHFQLQESPRLSAGLTNIAPTARGQSQADGNPTLKRGANKLCAYGAGIFRAPVL